MRVQTQRKGLATLEAMASRLEAIAFSCPKSSKHLGPLQRTHAGLDIVHQSTGLPQSLLA